MKWISLQTKTSSMFVLLLSFLATAGSVSAENITWNKNLREAAKTSQRLQKPMMIKFSASWCGYCRKMSKDTFSVPAIAQKVNGCFIPVAIDADQNKELVKALGVKGLPTTVIVSPKLTILKRITGYQTAAQFEKHLGGFCQQAKHETTLATTRPDPKATKKTAARIIPVAITKPVIAFEKHCLVSMLDDRKVRIGKPEFTSQHQGKTVCFSSTEFKKRFDANPKKYWPIANGVCQVTAKEKGSTVTGDPKAAAIFQQRLWFFADKTIRQQFAEQPRNYTPKPRSPFDITAKP
jgi:thioredoxin-related protein/YHS domain-containing protein